MLLNLTLENLEKTLQQKLHRQNTLSVETPSAFTKRDNNDKAKPTILYKKHFVCALFLTTKILGKSLNLTFPTPYIFILKTTPPQKILKNNVLAAIPYQNDSKHTLGGTGMSQEGVCVGVAYHHIVKACCYLFISAVTLLH